MATITTVSHGSYPQTPRRSYFTTSNYDTQFFGLYSNLNTATYQTNYFLSTVQGASSAVCNSNAYLRETGKKIYPGQYSGINSYYVSVFDDRTHLTGFINPNNALFLPLNTDKPLNILNELSTTGTSDDVNAGNYGPPVNTKGTINSVGYISTQSYLHVNEFALVDQYISSGQYVHANTFILADSYISSMSSINAGINVNAGSNLTAVSSITAGGNLSVNGFVSTQHVYLDNTTTNLKTVGSNVMSNGPGSDVTYRKSVVTNVGCTSNSFVFLTNRTINNAGTVYSVEGLGANTFTIVSNNTSDASSINWLVIN